MPEKSVARCGVELFLKNHIESLIENEKIGSQLWTDFIEFLIEEIGRGKLNGIFNQNSDTIFNSIDTYFWQSLMRRFLRQLSELFVKELNAFSLKGGRDEIAKKLENNKTLDKKIGLALLKLYAPLLIQAVLHSITTKPACDKDSDLSKKMLPLGDWLMGTAEFADNRSRPNLRRPGLIDLVATELFVRTANDFLSVYLSDKTSIENEIKICSDVGRLICARLALDVRQSEIDWSIASPEEVEKFCTTWTAKTTLHRNLGLNFSAANEFIVKKLPDIVNTPKIHSLLSNKITRRKFWQDWYQGFSRHSAFDSHIYHYFPWSKITSSEVEQLFVKVFADFTNNEEEWTAIFIIKGINSKDRIA